MAKCSVKCICYIYCYNIWLYDKRIEFGLISVDRCVQHAVKWHTAITHTGRQPNQWLSTGNATGSNMIYVCMEILSRRITLPHTHIHTLVSVASTACCSPSNDDTNDKFQHKCSLNINCWNIYNQCNAKALSCNLVCRQLFLVLVRYTLQVQVRFGSVLEHFFGLNSVHV